MAESNPKKETVKINLPPKPEPAPVIQIPKPCSQEKTEQTPPVRTMEDDDLSWWPVIGCVLAAILLIAVVIGLVYYLTHKNHVGVASASSAIPAPAVDAVGATNAPPTSTPIDTVTTNTITTNPPTGRVGQIVNNGGQTVINYGTINGGVSYSGGEMKYSTTGGVSSSDWPFNKPADHTEELITDCCASGMTDTSVSKSLQPGEDVIYTFPTEFRLSTSGFNPEYVYSAFDTGTGTNHSWGLTRFYTSGIVKAIRIKNLDTEVINITFNLTKR